MVDDFTHYSTDRNQHYKLGFHGLLYRWNGEEWIRTTREVGSLITIAEAAIEDSLEAKRLQIKGRLRRGPYKERA